MRAALFRIEEAEKGSITFVDDTSFSCPRASTPLVALGNPLIERLSRYVTLGREEQDAITTLTGSHRFVGSGHLLVREGGRPDCVCLLLDGVAYRHRYLADGRRRILGYLLPGDMCDTHFVISDECDDNVATLCNSKIAIIPLTALMTTMVNFPKIERGLLMMSLIDASITREWLFNLGKRDAFQKLGHLFCELSLRFAFDGDHAFAEAVDVPLTQGDLADSMGLTLVHVNRVLQRFRRERLLSWSHHRFHILDFQRLAQLSAFDPRYLRLNRKLREPRMLAYG